MSQLNDVLSKIASQDEAKLIVNSWREQKQKVVFTKRKSDAENTFWTVD